MSGPWATCQPKAASQSNAACSTYFSSMNGSSDSNCGQELRVLSHAACFRPAIAQRLAGLRLLLPHRRGHHHERTPGADARAAPLSRPGAAPRTAGPWPRQRSRRAWGLESVIGYATNVIATHLIATMLARRLRQGSHRAASHQSIKAAWAMSALARVVIVCLYRSDPTGPVRLRLPFCTGVSREAYVPGYSKKLQEQKFQVPQVQTLGLVISIK